MRSAFPEEQAALAAEFRSACTVFEGSGLLGLLLAPEGSVLAANQALASALGRDGPAELEGLPLWPLLEPESGRLLHGLFRTAAEGLRERRGVVRLTGKSYDCRWIPKRHASGEVLGLVLLATDRTDAPPHDDEPEANEARFRALVEASSEVIYRMNADWSEMLQLRSPGFLRETAKPTREWLATYIPPEDQAQVRNAIHQAMHHRRVFELEHRVIRADGNLGWVFSRAVPVFDRTGEVREWFGAAQDVTERKLAKVAMRDGEALRRQALECAPDAVFAIDTEYRLLFDNRLHQQAVIERGGSPPRVGEIVLRPDYPPEVLDFWRAAYDRALNGEHFRLDVTWTNQRGQNLIFDNAFTPLHDGNGVIIGVLVVARDVTARERADRELRESETRYRELFENMNTGVAVYRALDDGRDFVFVEFNRAGERIDQDSRENLLGKRLTEVRPGVSDFGLLDALRRVWKTGSPERLAEHQYKDGRLEAWYDNSIYRLPSGQVVAIFEDVTAHVQAEEEILRQAGLIRSLLDSVPDIVFYKDVQGTHIGCNAAHADFLGRPPEAIIGRTDYDLYPAAVADTFREHDRRVLETRQPARHEEWVVAANGAKILHDTLRTPYSSPEGKLLGVLGVCRDITERARMEEERAAARARLAVVEEQERCRLARELHDQTAQRLVALAVDLKNLETNLAAGRPQTERVQALRRAVDDLQRQVREMAWDLRTGEVVGGDLVTALRDYAEDWSGRVGLPVDFAYRDSNGHPLPKLLEGTLYRVTQEALTNVEKHARASRVSVLLECEPSLVRLTVEDDGCGFDVEAIHGSVESSRRLGLLGMRERVLLVGGALLVESSPGTGTGTTLLVRIPVPAETKSP